MAQAPDEEHFEMLANRLLAGAVVPFLGAGVNLCDRPPTAPWEKRLESSPDCRIMPKLTQCLKSTVLSIH